MKVLATEKKRKKNHKSFQYVSIGAKERDIVKSVSNLWRQAFREEAQKPLSGNKGYIKVQCFQMCRYPALFFEFLKYI